jgi:hypothetical protein
MITTGHFLANPTTINDAILHLGQASMHWLCLPLGKALLWGTSGTTFIHLVTPQQQAKSDQELWNVVGLLTEALCKTGAYMSNMTIMWRSMVEQQQIQALAIEADYIVDKMLLAASTFVQQVPLNSKAWLWAALTLICSHRASGKRCGPNSMTQQRNRA